MTHKILITILFLYYSSLSFAQEKKDSITLLSRPADVGLVYPISSNGRHAARYSNKISIQAIAGVSGAVTGAAFAGIANIIKYNGNGSLIAGVTNIVGNGAKGVQIAGVLNSVKRQSSGLQVAGILNTTGGMEGLQIAGLFNKADDANTQFAGLVNVAHQVRGVQIAGLINIADSSDYPIGLINIIQTGEQSLSISTDESLTTLVSFRSGGRVLYGILGIGYNLKSDDDLYALKGGIGAHLWSYNHFDINVEGTQLWLDDFEKGSYFKTSFSILPAFTINDHFRIFAGPTLNYVHYKNEKGSDLIQHYLWDDINEQGPFHGLYIGAEAGITFIL